MLLNYCVDNISVLTTLFIVSIPVGFVIKHLLFNPMVDENIQTMGTTTVERSREQREVGVQTENIPNNLTSPPKKLVRIISNSQCFWGISIAEYPNLDIPVMEPTVIIQPNLINEVPKN